MGDFDRLPQAAQLPVLQDLAEWALTRYALPSGLSVRLVNLSENATYAVSPRGGGPRWALRIHRAGYRTRAEIASELVWLAELRRTGVVITPVPVPGRDGEVIQVAEDPRMAAPRHVVLSVWEAGEEPGIGDDLASAFETLGETAARMHHHSRSWQRPTWFTRPKWDFDTILGDRPHWGRWRDGIGVTPDRAALMARVVAVIQRRLRAYGQGPERFGLVHCDLRLANLLVDGDAVKVIDFDDSGFSWFLYDAATPVSFYEHDPQVPGLIEAWKTGYRQVGVLHPEDEAEIPTFLMLRRLLLVAWIGSHHETDLARSMGQAYTNGTDALCEDYLSRFG